MVGPLELIKMLHCRSPSLAITRTKGSKPTQKQVNCKLEGVRLNQRNSPNIKQEVTNETLCRVCLQKGSIPIFGLTANYEDYSIALSTFAGIQVNANDPYPKYLCESCKTLLQSAILFRKTAQKSDKLLKRPLKTKRVVQTDNVADNNEWGFPEISVQTKVKKEVKEKNVRAPFCKRCNIKFKTFEEYNEHKASEDHINKKVSCPICNKMYKQYSLRNHIVQLHTGKPSYMCEICGKLFMAQNDFNRHHLTHSYDLPIKCKLCPYRGRFKESLKIHMRSHTGEKPYQCKQCLSRFLSKSNLNKHTLTHKTVYDFKCDNNSCGRQFHTKRDLEIHNRVVHAGVLDHKCRFCNKAFGYRKVMSRHERIVHKRAKISYGIMPLYMQVDNMNKETENVAEK